MGEKMSEFKHWCGNCQIRVYNERHYGKLLSWQDCPYTCEYATAMRCSIKPLNTAACNTAILCEMENFDEKV